MACFLGFWHPQKKDLNKHVNFFWNCFWVFRTPKIQGIKRKTSFYLFVCIIYCTQRKQFRHVWLSCFLFFVLNNKRIKKSIELLCCIFLGFTHPKSLKDKATTFTVTFWVCFLVLSPPKKRIKQNPFNLFFSCPLRFSLRKN